MSTIEFTRDTWGKCVLPLVLAAAATASQSVSADIYMYTDSDGTRWLTNGSVSGKNAKLVARTPKAKKVKQQVAMNGQALDLPMQAGRPTGCMRLSHDQVERRTAPHIGAIRKYAQHYGVDENLIRAVMRQESCFNEGARSHVGATGLMQLMPGTADMLGVADIHDPKQNIRGGAKYLAQMLRRFDGNLQLAVAAYNAGPGAVDKHGGIPPYRETRDYVVKVLSEYKRLEQHQQQQQFARANQRNQNQQLAYNADDGQQQLIRASSRGQERRQVQNNRTAQPRANSYARSGYQLASFSRHQGADFAVFNGMNPTQYD